MMSFKKDLLLKLIKQPNKLLKCFKMLKKLKINKMMMKLKKEIWKLIKIEKVVYLHKINKMQCLMRIK